MEKIFITDEQRTLLLNAYESTLGTPDFIKYRCENYYKSTKTGRWLFATHGSPCPFPKAYFKKIKGETYLYSTNGDERVRLCDECKKLLLPTFI